MRQLKKGSLGGALMTLGFLASSSIGGFYQEHEKDFDGEEEDGPNELYQRWAQWTMPRVYPSGKPIAPDVIYKEWDKYLAKHPQPSVLSKSTTWQYAGPITNPSNGGGSGRINCIAFHPHNLNIMWAGTPAGGLWKTLDGGNSWTVLTDNLPNIGVASIAIDPNNPDTMYLATGDGYGYSYTNGLFWGGAYSNGLMKSTDGGKTFIKTSLDWQQTQSRQIFRVVMIMAIHGLQY